MTRSANASPSLVLGNHLRKILCPALVVAMRRLLILHEFRMKSRNLGKYHCVFLCSNPDLMYARVDQKDVIVLILQCWIYNKLSFVLIFFDAERNAHGARFCSVRTYTSVTIWLIFWLNHHNTQSYLQHMATEFKEKYVLHSTLIYLKRYPQWFKMQLLAVIFKNLVINGGIS